MIRTATPARTSREAVERLLNPRSVAVIGASGEPTRIGGIIVRLLVRHGFTGCVYPVNPKYDKIAGLRCYPRLDAIPADEPVDLAIVYLPAAAVPAVARECGERGVRGLVVISSGFAELDADGARLQDELVGIVRAYGMAMSGPNCAGVASFWPGLVAYGTTNFIELEHIVKGGVALLSASGGFGNTVFTYCQERSLGLSHIVGLGNEGATNAADFLDVLVDDPRVSLVLANLESVRDPAAFFAAADRAAERGIPVVALKGGRSDAGQKAIATHTAALGGSPQACAGAFRQHGIVQVTDLDELADTALLLTRAGPVAGDRVGVFSLAGGGTGLLSDIAADHGFTIAALDPGTEAGLAEILPKIAQPKNPLDTTAGFGRDPARLQAALTAFAADPNIDIVAFFPLASQVSYAESLVGTLVSAQASLAKPLVVIWTAGQALASGPWRRLHEAGVPLFTSTTNAFRALRRARTYYEFVAARARPGAADFGPYLAADSGLPTVLDSADARTALSGFGIALARTCLARTAAEAADAVEQFGAAALKIASADIAHKTEAGGVRLGLRERAAAQAAFTEVLANARAYAPEAALDGVEVQEMIDGGLELLLGVHTDDQLGPILTVAAGGVFTEILRDAAQRPVPISRQDADQMLAELRIAPLFDGFRGSPRYDRAAAIDAMLGLSAFAHSVRESRPEIDLNPLVVGPEGHGAVAVDVLLKLTQAC